MAKRAVAWILGAALSSLMALGLAGCSGIPDGVEAVQGFELVRYLGTWYEIARLDHRFERGLSDVTATYRLREDGKIEVVNRGYDRAAGEWKEATGVAAFVEDSDVGRLKVSFFGPFYGGYNIIELDKQEYGYAMVAGPTRSYLWILARDPSLEEATIEQLVAKAKALGFATDELIYVEHDARTGEELSFPGVLGLEAAWQSPGLAPLTVGSADTGIAAVLR